jgi:hypothetical protein
LVDIVWIYLCSYDVNQGPIMEKKEKRVSGALPSRRALSRGKRPRVTVSGRRAENAAKKMAAAGGYAAKEIARAILSKQPGLKGGVRGVFVKRSAAAIARIATHADEAKLHDALAAPTDVGTLAAVLSDTEVIGEGVRELDPMASLIARSIRHKAELTSRAGGVLGVKQVAELLGITRQAVDKRRRERKLLAVPRGSDFRYPVAQFIDGEVVAGLRDVLTAVGLRGAWGTLDFLTAADDELEGETPLGWLKRHPDQLEPVLRIASALGEHGA